MNNSCIDLHNTMEYESKFRLYLSQSQWRNWKIIIDADFIFNFLTRATQLFSKLFLAQRTRFRIWNIINFIILKSVRRVKTYMIFNINSKTIPSRTSQNVMTNGSCAQLQTSYFHDDVINYTSMAWRTCIIIYISTDVKTSIGAVITIQLCTVITI